MRRLFCYIAILVALPGCSAGVLFENAKLGFNDDRPTERVYGIFAKPAGTGRFPAVVLLHSCGGVLRHVRDDWPAFLTGNGYAVLTVDTFGSRNAGRCPGARHLGGLAMWRDAYGALDYLANRPDIDGDRIAVMGFSLGGSVIENLATAKNRRGRNVESSRGRNFKAGIVVYGFCSVAGRPAFPILEIIGDKDRNSYACPENGKIPSFSVAVLPGAYHGFDMPEVATMMVVSGNHQALYDSGATEKAQELTRRFLAKHLGN